ncbi:MAG: LPXTG cell wall anchor domain-containing protein, partial [Atopobiaceae bacterium]|nr:LPXTG cell wall anchor domain-containing protein [Atopobiaceae bacterium]
AEGNPVWSIYETDDGEALPAGTYTVTETGGELFDRDGVEYERTTTYRVGEEVTAEAAELEVTASGTARATVTNAYDTPKGVAKIKVAKAFEGDYRGDERFEFVLADEDGNEVGRAKAANGETAEFAPIRYKADDADGEFVYTITEVVPDEPTAGIVYNTDPVEVTVTLDEDLNASVAYGEDEEADHATITNKLEAPEAEASLSVTKQVVGEGYEGDEEFSFVLAKFKDYRDAFGALAPDSDALPTETVAKAKAGETATFGAITYTEPGLYWYTITELEPETKSEGMTYDTTPRIAYVYVDAELNVTVRYGLSFDSEEYAGLSDLERLEKLFEDLQSGKAEENVSDEKLTVSNYYTAPVPGSLTVRKVVSSTRSEDKQKDFGFRITLLESDNKTTNKLSGTFGDVEFKDGVAEFTLKADESKTARNLPFGEDGQLRYKVEETNAQGLTPRLTETKGSGGASATVTCVNTYTPPTTTTPKRSTTTTSVARTSTPKTGDPTNVAVIAGIAVVAIAAIAIGVFRRRRQ